MTSDMKPHKTYFSRYNSDADTYTLFHMEGEVLTIAPDDWPLIWPVGSDVSARYEHPEGIVLSTEEYKNIAERAPLEDAP